MNAVDETGWNVEAQLRWLWVVVSEQVTFCDILPGRGFKQAAALLGADYDGWLTHDGWAVYYKFLQASHKKCNQHLLRRCQDMAKVASPAATRFPLRVQALLEEGLALRDRYKNQEISLHGLWTATGRLEAKLDRLLARPYQIRPTAGWPNICNTSGLTSLPIFIVLVWMPPTMWPNAPSEL